MFQPMFISSTPSSAERPRQGAPAEWALLPLNVYSTETRPVPDGWPQDVSRLLPTWVKRQASTPSHTPSRTIKDLPATNSYSHPAQSHRVQAIPSTGSPSSEDRGW